MNELDAIKAEFNTAHDEFKSLTAKITAEGYEATAEEKSRFDELEAGLKAKKDQIESIIARSESEADRNERLNRAKALGEMKTKIDDYNFRRPNEAADFRGQEYGNDLGTAMAAWGRFGCSGAEAAATMDELNAGKRLGLNIASGEFKVTNPDVLQAYAGHLKNLYGEMNKSGRTAANVQLEGYYAADTDALDSRIPERAGYLNRPPEFLNTLEMNMVAFGGILQAPITIMVTDHYEDVIETYGDDTTHTGRQIGEGQTIGATLTPNFANITWKSYDFTSDDIPVSNRQLDRSRFGLPAYIAQMLGERLGRIQGTVFTTGTGAVTPQGILTACTAGGSYYETAGSLAIAYSDLLRLRTVLDPIFYQGFGPNLGWMAHPRTLTLLQEISTGTGEAKLKIGEENGPQNVMLGQRIYWNNAMTGPNATTYAWTAADKAIIYGDFSRFVVRRAGGGMPILIRDETTNRRSLGTIFTALMNFDSRLRDYGANPLAELRIKA